MTEHILFVTGHLAKPRLTKLLAGMAPADFTYEIVDIGVKVAALMTGQIIRRRLPAPIKADRVLLPGRFRGDLDALAGYYGRPVQRGPEDLQDLAEFFGRKGPPPDLSRQNVRIFAEIVEAPSLSVEAILARAALYRRDGADVIDLGCLPDTDFPHLEAATTALVAAGYTVSVDSADVDELRRGAKAGASYMLSLTEKTLHLAEEVDAVPVLIPARHGDLNSLLRAMDALDRAKKPYLADPILDPIHFGFTASLGRYAEVKGHDVAIHALRSLSGAHLTVQGEEATPTDVHVRARLQELVRELGLEQRVSLLDAVPRRAIPALLRETDVLINATHGMSADKVVFEALAACTPVVAASPVFDTLLPSALRFTDGDPAGLASAIRAAAVLPWEERRSLRARVEAEHSVEHWADEVVAAVRLAGG